MKTMTRDSGVGDAVARADRLEESGDLQGAVSVLEGAIVQFPQEPWLRARRGRLLKLQKRWRKAIEDFDVAIELKPNVPTTIFMRAVCRAMIGEFDGAVGDFEECIRLQPRSADAYWQLGVIHSFRRDNDKALEAYRRAFELEPDEYPGLKDVIVELERELEG